MANHKGAPEVFAFAVLLLASWLGTVARAHADVPSVETFFKRAQYRDLVLSPSGRFLAVVAAIDGRYGLTIVDLETRTASGGTSSASGDVLSVIWQDDDRLAFIVGDLHRGTGEPPQQEGIGSINRDGANLRVVAHNVNVARGEKVPPGGFQRPWTVGLLRAIPGTTELLLTARERSIESLDLYRYDTATGQKTLASYESPGNVARWIVDFDGVPRAAVTNDVRHDSSAWYVRKTATAGWSKVEEAKLGRLRSVPLQFDPDGKVLYVAARKDGDLDAIYEYEVETGTWRGPVVRHPERDIDTSNANFVVDYRERKLLGLRYVGDKPSVAWFDREFAAMQKSVDAALPETVNALQRRANRWVVVAFSDRNPGDVYLLDGKSMKMEKLFSYAPWIDPNAMAPTKWVRYRARDGLTIPALLTVPANAMGKPVALVVDIHGGPNVPSTRWGYEPQVQFLASRGYAVLQPQFRGTQGFGWKLLSSGYRRWGDEMQDDLEDGVNWAIAEGIADSKRVCFFGGSYGGYAAMWGAIKNAKLIKCAVSLAGVSSIDYMFDNTQTDLSRVADRTTLMAELIGDPKTERARFKRVNPLDNADRVGVPILLAYGAADVRVPLVHGTDFRAALDKFHKEYEWMVYRDEGHGLSRDANVVDFYGRVERFLAKYLTDSVVSSASRTAVPTPN